jgi:hypothetical protein
MSQQPALPGTVKDTGAHEGDILVGIGIHNQGLLVKVYQDQPAGSGGRVEGQVLLLHQGTGEYAEGVPDRLRLNDRSLTELETICLMTMTF